MSKPGWYIVAYDIADHKRLRKIHRILKKEGLAVQQSVFFVFGEESTLGMLLDKLETAMDTRKDDIRAYPVTRPAEVWTTGGPLLEYPLVSLGDKSREKKKPVKPNSKKPWWKKMW